MKRKIIFLGTSSFACPSIEILHNNHNLLAVVASSQPSPVKGLAYKLGIKVFDPATPNTPEFITILKDMNPEFFCLAAYGHILSGDFLKTPKFASINLHPSLLPKYRGAAPLQWAILNGDKNSGITTFIMDEKIDHGKILLQEKMEIGEEETFGELETRTSKIGAELFLKTIDNFDNLTPVPQNMENLTKAPKITKEMRKIDWNKPAKEIFNLIRALSPTPLTYTTLRNKELEIIRAGYSELSGKPGEVLQNKGKIIIGTAKNGIELKILKPQAKKEQTALDFINGYRPQIGEVLG
ncbi:MAG: methionyl-tRNA formyltransferase [bacterium]